jgi:putative transcriptional regulator
MIQHHPGEDLLLALAAGRVSAGVGLVLSVHLEGCSTCRARLRELELIGGVLLADGEDVALAPEAWPRTLQRVEARRPGGVAPAPARTAAPPARRTTLPAGVPWPAALAGCDASRWRWIGPGMRWSRLTLPQDPDVSLYLLRIAPGRSLPSHTHRGNELTQVLCGSFDDGRSYFAAGDFDATDDAVRHQPVVRAGAECVCVAHVEGNLVFDGAVASVIGRWIGM